MRERSLKEAIYKYTERKYLSCSTRESLFAHIFNFFFQKLFLFFFKSLFFAQHNSSKLPMNHVRIFLALSNRASNDTASPQQPKPSLASFDAESQSGWMEAVGSWLFV